MASTRSQSGFSLVELSIVLVILGLLVGGVLAGQSLIRAAELRSISADHSRYVAATQTFRDKYFSIPGDMSNATSFWGVDPDGCPNHTNRIGKTATCNGDGNGRLSTGSGSTLPHNEIYRFWQHLANAGLIEGSYTGVGGTASLYHRVVGQNVPTGKLSRSGWDIQYLHGPGELLDDGSGIFYGNTMHFGRQRGDFMFDAILRPDEMWGVDLKMDDGMPRSGKIITNEFNTCADAISISDLEAAYNLDLNSVVCLLRFPDFTR